MTKQKNIIIMMLAFLMLLPVGSAAQEVVQKLDSLQILIGEQTKLHLKVTAAKGAKVVLPSFKPSQMLIPGIEVVEQSDADTAELDGGRLQISRDYTLTSFDEKVYAVPALQVKVNGKTCQGNPLALKVLTVPVDTVHPNQFYPPRTYRTISSYGVSGVLCSGSAFWYSYSSVSCCGSGSASVRTNLS